MEAHPHTLADVRQLIASCRTLCKRAAQTMGHDYDSCACEVCQSKRFLKQVLDRLKNLDRPQLEQDW